MGSPLWLVLSSYSDLTLKSGLWFQISHTPLSTVKGVTYCFRPSTLHPRVVRMTVMMVLYHKYKDSGTWVSWSDTLRFPTSSWYQSSARPFTVYHSNVLNCPSVTRSTVVVVAYCRCRLLTLGEGVHVTHHITLVKSSNISVKKTLLYRILSFIVPRVLLKNHTQLNFSFVTLSEWTSENPVGSEDRSFVNLSSNLGNLIYSLID